MPDTTPLQLDEKHVHQPLPLINPTRAGFRHVDLQGSISSDNDCSVNDLTDRTQKPDTASNIQFKWTSRNNRKGRHAIVVKPEDAASDSYEVPPYSSSVGEVCRIIWLMATYYPVWVLDVSWLVAYIFTLGSVVWVINAFLVFYPQLTTVPNQDDLILYGGGITAFIGATIFEIGSVLLILEAFNAQQGGCFGWALEQVLSGEEKGSAVVRATPSTKMCQHHHPNRRNLVGHGTAKDSEAWTWWPSGKEFHRHYLHDLGFIASLSQLIGATIFWISGFTALPGVYDVLSPAALIGAYWVPQVVGGSFFIISGTLFMLETQKRWWLPELKVLGWHIGLLNAIGGVGFTLCPAFGLDPALWAQYQSSCSTFWGSWAFLIGSMLQWYESLNKYPVERSQ